VGGRSGFDGRVPETLALTTRPFGMGMVAPASLLLGVVIQASTPILVAVLASMATTTINGFSTQPIVAVVALIPLGAILALVGLVNSRFLMKPVSPWIIFADGPVSHWMPVRISPLTNGPYPNGCRQRCLHSPSAPYPRGARISLLVVGSISHWMLVRTKLLVFGRMPLTRIEKMMPMISKLTVTTCRSVFHWMPLPLLEMVLLLRIQFASLKTLKNYLPLLPVDPTLIFRREIRFYLAQPFELYRKEVPFVPTCFVSDLVLVLFSKSPS
jgi:hypothetical protein